MQLPPKLISSLEKIESFDKKAFERVHQFIEPVTSIRLNPAKNFELKALNLGFRVGSNQFENSAEYEDAEIHFSRVPWSGLGYYLSVRPSFTFDPSFHAGCYYVQEASSMFLEQALTQTVDLSKPLKVLDLSAAPGGKTTHIQSLLSADSFLISNEVIRSRANILKNNVVKWGAGNVMITNNNPADFRAVEKYFDVIVVDAPCSGSGLFPKDAEALKEWTEKNVALCSERQERILSSILPCLKKDGILIYSTCSYSKEEDEDIAGLLVEKFGLDYIPLKIQPEWKIVDTGKGYRFWPDKTRGEGFYLSCFRNSNEISGSVEFRTKKRKDKITAKEKDLVQKWLGPAGFEFVRNGSDIYLWPQQSAGDFYYLLENLRVIYSGVMAGELVHDKFLPSHALALSNYLSPRVESTDLTYKDAILYLQRRVPDIIPKTKGRQVVTYEKNALGWINALPGRINNYYPKEMRIIKDN